MTITRPTFGRFSNSRMVSNYKAIRLQFQFKVISRRKRKERKFNFFLRGRLRFYFLPTISRIHSAMACECFEVTVTERDKDCPESSSLSSRE